MRTCEPLLCAMKTSYDAALFCRLTCIVVYFCFVTTFQFKETKNVMFLVRVTTAPPHSQLAFNKDAITQKVIEIN